MTLLLVQAKYCQIRAAWRHFTLPFKNVKMGNTDPTFFVVSRPSDPPPKRTQGTATDPRRIQVWSGSGQTLGHRFAYDAVKSEQHGATLHYPFSWDEGDGTGSHDF